MKKLWKPIPGCIQRQILTRWGMSLVVLLLGVCLLVVRFDYISLIVLGGLTLLCICSGFKLLATVLDEKYVIVPGRCIEMSQTPIKKRVKSITLDASGTYIKVMLKPSRKRTYKGMLIKLYLDEQTHIYERDGMKHIYEYLAIDVGAKAVDKK